MVARLITAELYDQYLVSFCLLIPYIPLTLGAENLCIYDRFEIFSQSFCIA